jgi:hypothetical protein
LKQLLLSSLTKISGGFILSSSRDGTVRKINIVTGDVDSETLSAAGVTSVMQDEFKTGKIEEKCDDLNKRLTSDAKVVASDDKDTKGDANEVTSHEIVAALTYQSSSNDLKRIGNHRDAERSSLCSDAERSSLCSDAERSVFQCDAKGSNVRSDAEKSASHRDAGRVKFEVDANFCLDHGDCVMDMSVDGNLVMTVGSDAKIKLWAVTLGDDDEEHLRRIITGNKLTILWRFVARTINNFKKSGVLSMRVSLVNRTWKYTSRSIKQFYFLTYKYISKSY